jgi:hypothetical protein
MKKGESRKRSKMKRYSKRREWGEVLKLKILINL